MFTSKHVGSVALAVLISAPVLTPAVGWAGSGAGRSATAAIGVEHGAGQGTIVLPGLGSDGLLAAVLMSAESRYGLDAMLTIWIPSEPVPELMFGGLYGRLFADPSSGADFKARVEGTWKMVSDEIGEMDALVLEDSSEGARVVGRISGKFLVERVGARSGVGNAGGHSAVLAGNIGLQMVLAH